MVRMATMYASGYGKRGVGSAWRQRGSRAVSVAAASAPMDSPTKVFATAVATLAATAVVAGVRTTSESSTRPCSRFCHLARSGGSTVSPFGRPWGFLGAATTTFCAPTVAASQRPSPPLRFLSSVESSSSSSSLQGNEPLFDLIELGERLDAAETRRQEAFDLSRRINVALTRSRVGMERGMIPASAGEDGGDLMGTPSSEIVAASAELESLVQQALEAGAPSSSSSEENNDDMKVDDSPDAGATTRPTAGFAPREANLSYRIEDYMRHKSFLHFLETGTLLSPSSFPLVTDEEYLGGACIGLTQDLARYGIGRGTVRDVSSVVIARNVVSDVMDQLLQFDFRNGPLRRKYDGTKYALKTLETVLYELSVTGAPVAATDSASTTTTTSARTPIPASSDEPDAKKSRTEKGPDSSRSTQQQQQQSQDDAPTAAVHSRIPTSELQALRKRMERRDELRESLIKRCRDGQKAAKQSIFALHRGDVGRASKLLQQCEDCVQKDLLPILREEPSLRHGSFSNLMEEYAEARLFYAWLVGRDDDNAKSASDRRKEGRPPAALLGPTEFPLHLEPEEYIGGLCDLTGEIGRYAVQRGTARDSPGVRLCLRSNLSILVAIQTMKRTPGGAGKKLEMLRRTVEKQERMLYELSLVQATGGNVIVESVKGTYDGTDSGGGGDRDENRDRDDQEE